jgi:hypothetical protein
MNAQALKNPAIVSFMVSKKTLEINPIIEKFDDLSRVLFDTIMLFLN